MESKIELHFLRAKQGTLNMGVFVFRKADRVLGITALKNCPVYRYPGTRDPGIAIPSSDGAVINCVRTGTFV